MKNQLISPDGRVSFNKHETYKSVYLFHRLWGTVPEELIPRNKKYPEGFMYVSKGMKADHHLSGQKDHIEDMHPVEKNIYAGNVNAIRNKNGEKTGFKDAILIEWSAENPVTLDIWIFSGWGGQWSTLADLFKTGGVKLALSDNIRIIGAENIIGMESEDLS